MNFLTAPTQFGTTRMHAAICNVFGPRKHKQMLLLVNELRDTAFKKTTFVDTASQSSLRSQRSLSDGEAP